MQCFYCHLCPCVFLLHSVFISWNNQQNCTFHRHQIRGKESEGKWPSQNQISSSGCASLDKTLLAPSAHAEQLHARYQHIFNRSKRTSCLTLWIKVKVKFMLQIIYSTLFRINIPAEKENTLLVSGREAHCKISLLPWKEALCLETRAMKENTRKHILLDTAYFCFMKF